MIDLPLLRHIDALSDEDMALWLDLDAGKAPLPVFGLADATATYALALETSYGDDEVANLTQRARSVEAELIPVPPSVNDKKASYAIAAAGSRFEVLGAGTETKTMPVVYDDRSGSNRVDVWSVAVEVSPRKRAETASKNSLPVTLGEAQELLGKLQVQSGVAWDAWAPHAPVRTATVKITRPSGVLNPANPTIDWSAYVAQSAICLTFTSSMATRRTDLCPA